MTPTRAEQKQPFFSKAEQERRGKTTDVSQPIAKTKATDQQADQGAMLCPHRPADATYRLGSRALLHLGCGSSISYNLLLRRSSGLIQKIHFIFSFSVWHFWREYGLFRERIFDLKKKGSLYVLLYLYNKLCVSFILFVFLLNGRSWCHLWPHTELLLITWFPALNEY